MEIQQIHSSDCLLHDSSVQNAKCDCKISNELYFYKDKNHFYFECWDNVMNLGVEDIEGEALLFNVWEGNQDSIGLCLNKNQAIKLAKEIMIWFESSSVK